MARSPLNLDVPSSRCQQTGSASPDHSRLRAGRQRSTTRRSARLSGAAPSSFAWPSSGGNAQRPETKTGLARHAVAMEMGAEAAKKAWARLVGLPGLDGVQVVVDPESPLAPRGWIGILVVGETIAASVPRANLAQ